MAKLFASEVFDKKSITTLTAQHKKLGAFLVHRNFNTL
jgi:hypothetical protein